MAIFPTDLLIKAETLLNACRLAGLRIATAESCTGGLICAILTAVPGSSEVVDRGFVTYSDAAKIEVLGVTGELLRVYGAVSEPVARAMVEGVLARCPSVTLATSVTGIAGPDGNSSSSHLQVGLVHVAVARRGVGMMHRCARFLGNRAQVRLATVTTSLSMLEVLTRAQPVCDYSNGTLLEQRT